jgi:metallo-beta-lactamase class B
MLKYLAAGLVACVLLAGVLVAQSTPPPAPAGDGRGGRQGGGRGVAGAASLPNAPADSAPAGTPTEEQWNKPEAQAFVTKAKALAGDDPDLQYDFSFNCTAAGSHIAGGGGARMTVGDGAILQNTDPKIPYIEVPAGQGALPPQRVFDNLWRFGGSGVGAWLITSNDGYLLFDALNDAHEARDVIVGGMKQVGLDPARIRYMAFGHFHLDHTGGGHYIEENIRPQMILMGRDDWPLYFRSVASSAGQGARLQDKTPMKRGADLQDGQKLTIGDTTVTFVSMPGHTPGSTGMIFPAKYQGRTHNVLVVTASAGGNNVRNRESFIGGYEHIWNWGLRENVESVLNAHLNYNHNTLSRMTYVTRNYPPARNPMLYGVEKTRRYIEITRACSQARLEALGW